MTLGLPNQPIAIGLLNIYIVYSDSLHQQMMCNHLLSVSSFHLLATQPHLCHRPRGDNLLFADADGATTFGDLSKLEEEMTKIAKEGQVRSSWSFIHHLSLAASPSRPSLRQGIVCGSRAHLEDESIAQRTIIRTILM